MKSVKPIYKQERIHTIDILRGVALLGILLINIVGMGLPDPAYFDPSLSGGSDGLNRYVYFFNSVFIEGAMRGIFSLLFGAGIILFINEKEDKENFSEVLEVWFRRLLWLIPIGMLNAYVLLWPGDILFSYGLIGLLLFPFRKLKPFKLIAISLLILLIGTWLNVQDAKTAKREQKQYFESVAMIHKGEKLPYDTMIGYYNWMEKYAIMKPNQDILQSRIENYHKGYRKAFQENKPYARFFESEYHYRHNYIDIFSMMLLGMALFKMRILHAERSTRFYVLMLFIGYGVGVSINYLETKTYIDSGFDLIRYYELLISYDLGRITTMFGHIALVMLFSKLKAFSLLKQALAAVGKMALTNYLMHSLIAAIVFVGFRQYGLWQRFELYYLVAAIWLFQLVISPFWLRFYRFGPVEWLWRRLSYLERLPLRKENRR